MNHNVIVMGKNELLEGKTNKRKNSIKNHVYFHYKNEVEAFLILSKSHKTRRDFFQPL